MAIQRLIGFGKKEEFKEILAILRRQITEPLSYQASAFLKLPKFP
jgi:hypothetical protein